MFGLSYITWTEFLLFSITLFLLFNAAVYCYYQILKNENSDDADIILKKKFYESEKEKTSSEEN